jgi:hypothetical protein
MKARLIRPAVTIAIAVPWKWGHVGALDPLADAGKENQHQREADGTAGTEQQRLDEIMLVGDVQQGTPSTAQLVVISGR